MAFNINAQVILDGPKNLSKVRNDIKKNLSSISVPINVTVNKRTNRDVVALDKGLKGLNNTLQDVTANARLAKTALNNLGKSVKDITKGSASLSKASKDINKSLKNTQDQVKATSTEISEFGKDAALAIRRFSAFTVATGTIFGFLRAVKSATSEAIKFERELAKITQVTAKSQLQLQGLTKTIDQLSVSLGVDANKLVEISRIFAQTGQSINQVQNSLKAVARASLTASFGDIERTTEGVIAALNQFGFEARKTEDILGSLNAVSKKFAVESDDLISVIRRAGGVFAATSKQLGTPQEQLSELIGIFTAVRSTTRESADTIATGLRTIFSRIQRPRTIEFLKDLGIQLRATTEDAKKFGVVEGEFIGIFEALKRVSGGIKNLDTLQLAQVVEELGGIRQVGKLIPALQNFAKAEQARKVALEGTASISKDVAIATQTLSVQIEQLQQRFGKLVRDISQSQTFQNLAKLALSTANAFVTFAESLKPIVPLLTAVASVKLIGGLAEFGKGFVGGLKKGGGAGGAGGALGGALTGGGGGGAGGAAAQANTAAEKENTSKTVLNTKELQDNTNALSKLTSGVNKLFETSKSLSAQSSQLIAQLKQLPTSLRASISSAGILPRATPIRRRGRGGKLKKFANGGFVQGPSHAQGGVVAELEGGEFIVPKRLAQGGITDLKSRFAQKNLLRSKKRVGKNLNDPFKEGENQFTEKDFVFSPSIDKKEIDLESLIPKNNLTQRRSYNRLTAQQQGLRFEELLVQKGKLKKPNTPGFKGKDAPLDGRVGKIKGLAEGIAAEVKRTGVSENDLLDKLLRFQFKEKELKGTELRDARFKDKIEVPSLVQLVPDKKKFTIQRRREGGLVGSKGKAAKTVGAAIFDNVSVSDAKVDTIRAKDAEKSGTFANFKNEFDINPKFFGSRSFSIKRQGLRETTRKDFNDLLEKQITASAQNIARGLASDLGVTTGNTKIPDSDVANFIKGINPGTRGNLFEDTLKVLIGPPFNTDSKAAFDFTQGLGNVLKDDFDALAGLSFIDAKASLKRAGPSDFRTKLLNQIAKEAIQAGEPEGLTRVGKQAAASRRTKSATRGATGGLIGLQDGGMVPVAVSKDELMVPSSTTDKFESQLKQINSGKSIDPSTASKILKDSSVVSGPGTGTSDSIRGSVPSGTFVVNAKDTARMIEENRQFASSGGRISLRGGGKSFKRQKFQEGGRAASIGAGIAQIASIGAIVSSLDFSSTEGFVNGLGSAALGLTVLTGSLQKNKEELDENTKTQEKNTKETDKNPLLGRRQAKRNRIKAEEELRRAEADLAVKPGTFGRSFSSAETTKRQAAVVEAKKEVTKGKIAEARALARPSRFSKGLEKTRAGLGLLKGIKGPGALIGGFIASGLVDSITAGAKKEVAGVTGFEKGVLGLSKETTAGAAGGISGAAAGAGVGALFGGPVGAAIGGVIGGLDGFLKAKVNQIKFDAFNKLNESAQNVTKSFAALEGQGIENVKALQAANQSLANLSTTRQAAQAAAGETRDKGIINSILGFFGREADTSAFDAESTIFGKIGAGFDRFAANVFGSTSARQRTVRGQEIGGQVRRGQDFAQSIQAIPPEALEVAEQNANRAGEAILKSIPVERLGEIANLGPEASFDKIVGSLRNASDGSAKFNEQLKLFEKLRLVNVTKEAQAFTESLKGTDSTLAGLANNALRGFQETIENGGTSLQASNVLFREFSKSLVRGGKLTQKQGIEFFNLAKAQFKGKELTAEQRERLEELGKTAGFSSGELAKVVNGFVGVSKSATEINSSVSPAVAQQKILAAQIKKATAEIDAFGASLQKFTDGVSVAVKDLNVAFQNSDAIIEQAGKIEQSFRTEKRVNVFEDGGRGRSTQELQKGIEVLSKDLGINSDKFKGVAESISFQDKLPDLLKQAVKQTSAATGGDFKAQDVLTTLSGSEDFSKLPDRIKKAFEATFKQQFLDNNTISRQFSGGSEKAIEQFETALESIGGLDKLRVADDVAKQFSELSKSTADLRSKQDQINNLNLRAARERFKIEISNLRKRQSVQERFEKFTAGGGEGGNATQRAFTNLGNELRAALGFGGQQDRFGVQFQGSQLGPAQSLLERGNKLSEERLELEKQKLEADKTGDTNTISQLNQSLINNTKAIEGNKTATQILSQNTSVLAGIEKDLAKIQEARLSSRQRFDLALEGLSSAQSPEEFFNVARKLEAPLVAFAKALESGPESLTLQEESFIREGLKQGTGGALAQQFGLDSEAIERLLAGQQKRFLGDAERFGFDTRRTSSLFAAGTTVRGETPFEKQRLALAQTFSENQIDATNESSKATIAAIESQTNILEKGLQNVSKKIEDLALKTGFGNRDGGFVGKFAKGGLIPGFRTGGMKDNKIAAVQSGEFIVNKKATQENLGLLESINSFQQGGQIDDRVTGRARIRARERKQRLGRTRNFASRNSEIKGKILDRFGSILSNDRSYSIDGRGFPVFTRSAWTRLLKIAENWNQLSDNQINPNRKLFGNNNNVQGRLQVLTSYLQQAKQGGFNINPDFFNSANQKVARFKQFFGGLQPQEKIQAQKEKEQEVKKGKIGNAEKKLIQDLNQEMGTLQENYSKLEEKGIDYVKTWIDLIKDNRNDQFPSPQSYNAALKKVKDSSKAVNTKLINREFPLSLENPRDLIRRNQNKFPKNRSARELFNQALGSSPTFQDKPAPLIQFDWLFDANDLPDHFYSTSGQFNIKKPGRPQDEEKFVKTFNKLGEQAVQINLALAKYKKNKNPSAFDQIKKIIPGFRKGGLIPGQFKGFKDSEMMMAESGSFIVRRSQSNGKNLSILKKINNGFRDGGKVPIAVQPGEFFVPADKAIGNEDLLNSINKGFQTGGRVGRPGILSTNRRNQNTSIEGVIEINGLNQFDAVVSNFSTSIDKAINFASQLNTAAETLKALPTLQVSVNGRVAPVEVILNGTSLLNTFKDEFLNQVLEQVAQAIPQRNADGSLNPPQFV